MRKRRKALMLVACLAALAAIVAFVSRNHEPHYQGQSLTYWISFYRLYHEGVQLQVQMIASPEEVATADNAVRHIGTNALPYLIKWFEYDPDPRLRRIQAIFRYVPARLWRAEFVRHHILEDPGQLRSECAERALVVLRPQVTPPIPELIRIANGTNANFLVRFTMFLDHMGKDAIPALAAAATNTANPLRYYAITQIGDFGTNAVLAVPVLTHLLQDPEPHIRTRATNALQRITAAIPTIAPAR